MDLKPRRPSNKLRSQTSSPDEERFASWKKYLPVDWRDAVEAPLHMKHFSEYELAAERSVGYDADDHPCFTAHQFILTRLTTDDDEEFYESVAYTEEMAAWRLRDDRWLVFRLVGTTQTNPPRGFYVISPDMPR